MFQRRRLDRGIAFVTLYAAAATLLQLSAGDLVPFHPVDLFLIGVGLAAYLFSWFSAFLLFLASIAICTFIFPESEGSLRFRTVPDIIGFLIYTVANLVIIAGFHILQSRLAAFRRTEESYRTLVDSASDGIVVFDQELRFVEVNASFCEILGFSREELLTRSVLDVLPDRSALPVEIEDARAGKTTVRECGMRRKDSTFVDVETSARMLRDGRILAIIRDITDRKRLQAAVEQSEERFRRLSQATTEGVFIHENGKILDANQSLASMLGYEVSELIGADAFQFVPDLEARESIMRNIAAGFQDVFETSVERKNGTVFPVEVVGKPFSFGGKSLRVAACRDITERKRLQEHLREAQKMEATARLAGGVAHDFNNLLTIIGGYAHMLLEEEGLSKAARTGAEEIAGATGRAAQLCGELLAFGGRQLIHPRPMDLNEVVSNLRELLNHAAGESIAVELKLAPDPLWISADPVHLEQTILNLVLNARESMSGRGKVLIETTLAAGEPVPYEGSSNSGERVALAIRDTGPALTDEEKAQLFEPFSKQRGRKRKATGLAAAYGTVKQHGGHISVDSDPGRGTTFRVLLPKIEAPQALEEQAPETREGRIEAELKILLVEDDPPLRRLVADILAEKGFEVVEAENGVQALEFYEQHGGSIGLILTDIIMPKMTGLEFAQTVKTRAPEIPVLFMSGYTDELTVALPQGGASFIQKPFTPEALVEKIRHTIGKSGF